jgi:hypothetical protein
MLISLLARYEVHVDAERPASPGATAPDEAYQTRLRALRLTRLFDGVLSQHPT